MPACSIVIPTYNRAELVARAVRSVLGQTLRDLEVVVVDNGSQDSTAEVIRGIEDSRVRYVRLDPCTRTAARNSGARLATGRILAFLDSDDELQPDWFERVAAEFEQPNVGLVSVGVEERWADGRAPVVGHPRSLGPLFDGRVATLLAGAFAVQRELFIEIGGYDEALDYAENTELGLRLLPAIDANGLRLAAIDEPVLIYHRGASRLTLDGCRERLEGARRLLHRHGKVFAAKDRRGLGSYHAVAGVNAVRLGLGSEGRRHLSQAVTSYPRNWRHWGRLAVSLLPGVARRLWLRSVSE